MTIYEAREFLHELQDEYQRKRAERPDDDRRYDLALECLDDTSTEDKLKLIWASGAIDTAMEAALDEVLEAIRSTNRDYAY
jgi:hypothetical protein